MGEIFSSFAVGDTAFHARNAAAYGEAEKRVDYQHEFDGRIGGRTQHRGVYQHQARAGWIYAERGVRLRAGQYTLQRTLPGADNDPDFTEAGVGTLQTSNQPEFPGPGGVAKGGGKCGTFFGFG